MSQHPGNVRSRRQLSISGSALVNFAGQGISAVVALVCVPFVVKAIGLDRFALLSLLWVVIGYFSILDFGLGPAVTHGVAVAISKGQRGRVSPLFWAANRLQLALSAVGAIGLLLSGPVLVKVILNVPEALRSEATISLYLCACALPAVVMSSSVVGLIQAARRFDLTTAVQVPLSVGQFVLPLVCALVWTNLPFIIGALLVSRIIALVTLFLLAYRLFPELAGSQPPDRDAWRSLATFGGWITVSSVLGPLMVYADRFLLGHLHTLAAVSYYSVPSDASARLLIIPRSLVPVLFPVFSGSRDAAANSELAARALKYMLILVGIPVLVLIALAGTLMTIWMGREFAVRSTFAFQILLVGVLLNSLAYVPSALTQAVGRADITAKLHMIELPLYAVAAYVAISQWGIPGAAAAWSLRVLVDLALLLCAAWRVANLSPRRVLECQAPQLAAAWAVLAATALAAEVSTDRATTKLLVAAAVAAVGIVGAWVIFLGGEDRTRIGQMFQSLRQHIVPDPEAAGRKP